MIEEKSGTMYTSLRERRAANTSSTRKLNALASGNAKRASLRGRGSLPSTSEAETEMSSLNSESMLLSSLGPSDHALATMTAAGLVQRDRNEEEERELQSNYEQLAGAEDEEEAPPTMPRLMTHQFTSKMERLKGQLQERRFKTRIETMIELGDLAAIVDQIEHQGLDVNFRLSFRKPLLLFASQHGKLPIVKYLYKMGADINLTDQALKTPLMRAAETKQLLVVRFLITHGANVLQTEMFGRTAFELCVRSDAAHLKGAVLSELAHQYDHRSHHLLANGLEKLFEIQHTRRETVDSPNTLRELAQVVVRRSPVPLIECLKFAEKFQILAGGSLSFGSDYAQMAQYFTNCASQIVNTMSSDLVCSWLLEAAVMDVALNANNNIGFFNNARVNRILDTWYNGYGWQYYHKFEKESEMAWLRPSYWTSRARTRFYVDALLFFVFLLLFSYLMLNNPAVGAPFSFVEILLYMFVAGHVQREIAQFRGTNYLLSYLSDGWNLLDIVIALIFCCTFVMRVLYNAEGEDTGALPGELPFEHAETVYRVLMGLNSVLMWVRILFVTTVLSRLGPLLRIINKMLTTDLLSFTWVMIAFLVGFSLAFVVLSGDTNASQGYGFLLFQLFQTFTGEIVLTLPDGEFETLQYASMLFLVFYIFMSSILLLNLLIAMMSTTYEAVEQKSTNEYNLSRAALVWHYDDPHESFPPPLNTIILILDALISAFLFVTSYCWSTHPNERLSCGHCGHSFDEARAKKLAGASKAERVAMAKQLHSVDGYDKEWVVQRYIQLMADHWYRDNDKVVRYARYRHKLTSTLQADICQKCCRLLNERSIVRASWRRVLSMAVFTVLVYLPVLVLLSPTLLYFIPRSRRYKKKLKETLKRQYDLRQQAKQKSSEDKAKTPKPRRLKRDSSRKKSKIENVMFRSPHRDIGVPQNIPKSLENRKAGELDLLERLDRQEALLEDLVAILSSGGVGNNAELRELLDARRGSLTSGSDGRGHHRLGSYMAIGPRARLLSSLTEEDDGGDDEDKKSEVRAEVVVAPTSTAGPGNMDMQRGRVASNTQNTTLNSTDHIVLSPTAVASSAEVVSLATVSSPPSHKPNSPSVVPPPPSARAPAAPSHASPDANTVLDQLQPTSSAPSTPTAPPPPGDSSAHHSTAQELSVSELAALPAPWEVYKNDHGIPYFHNPTTDETRWTPPTED